MEEEEEIDLSLLERVPLFADCSEETLRSLAKHMRRKKVEQNEYLVKRGEIAQEMFFIINGRVSIMAGSTTETNSHITDLGDGSFCGEMGLLYEIPRTASVITLTTCDLCVLQKNDFEEFKKLHPEIIEKIRLIADKRFEWFKNHLKQNASDSPSFSNEQIEKFRKAFMDVDLDGNGTVDFNGLGILMYRLTGKEFSQTELNVIMQKIDIDKNKSIDFDEFVIGLRHLKWLVGDPSLEEIRQRTLTEPRGEQFKKYVGYSVIIVLFAITIRFAYSFFSSGR